MHTARSLRGQFFAEVGKWEVQAGLAYKPYAAANWDIDTSGEFGESQQGLSDIRVEAEFLGGMPRSIGEQNRATKITFGDGLL